MTTPTGSRQHIEVDPARKLVIVTASGFFTPEATHAATMEMRAALRTLGAAVGQHVTLYDMRGVSASSNETVELLRMAFANPVYKPLRARKVAFVATSRLLRRQIDRVREARPDMRIYDDYDAALAWLLEPDGQRLPR